MVLSRLIDGGIKVLDQEKLIKGSVLFDADWYAGQQNVKGGSAKALGHFLKSNGKFDPCPNFSSSAYLSDNPDVRDAGLNPLLHYLRFGKDEGRVIRNIHGHVSGDADHGLGEKALGRMRQLFDTRFYKETNPDLDLEIDGFEHFMSVGWRQKRDPVPWFSLEAYGNEHGDIDGKNPFAHYVLTGSREGRTIRASRRKKMDSSESAPKTLSVAAVAMVKNEADIIALFASHLLALFDDIVIVDHQSEDGTTAFLKELSAQYPRVQVLTLCEPSYIQSVTMTHVIRDMACLRQADWVFLLDADEFLPFETREEFHQKLQLHQRCPIISLHWQNLIPVQYWSDIVEITPDTEFFHPPKPSPFCKIAFQPNRFNLSQVVVAQGNHALIGALNGLEMQAFDADFCLLHIPIRSTDQLLLKLNQGVQSYQKIGRTRDAGQGTHWYRMKQATVGQSIHDSFLNAMAVGYSEDNQTLEPIEHSDLTAMCYSQGSIQFAREEIFTPIQEKRGLGEMLMRLYAEDFSNAADKDDASSTRLETCENGDLVRLENYVAEYPALPALKEPPTDLMAALETFLPASHRSIEDLVPSDWNGHVPFMFALVAMTQPRRYVELGTLRGASFFAFAQAVNDSKVESEAIAISSWSLGRDVEDNYENAFETFKFITSKYRDMTGILRMGYAKAAHRFAERSIDLLNLDGFCDAVNLEHVLEIWQPKLSERGMIMLHDINSQNPDSAVWRVWEQLKQRYPSLEFRHDQGLGLACCGEAVSPSLLKIAEGARKHKALQVVLQDHFSQQGRTAAELFSRRYDMAQMDLRSGNEAALAEELAWCQQELSAKRAELDDMRALLGAEFSNVAGA